MATMTATQAPGPRGHFLTGCLGEFRADPIGLLLRSAEQYGDVVRLRIGPVVAHLVNHPDHIEHVFVRNARNYDKNTRSVSRLRATCGKSLLTTDGELWSRHRKFIQPAFQPAMMQRIEPIAKAAISQMLDRWGEAATAGRPLDIVSEMMHVTLKIAAQSLFGVDMEREVKVVEESLAVILDDTWRRLESWIDLSNVSTAFESRQFRTAINAIDAIVYRIIEVGRKRPGAAGGLLSALLLSRDVESGGGLTDEELRDATITLLLAGHETTANALAWTFYLVSQASEVQTRLHDELVRSLAGRSPRLADFERLPYMSQVFSEAKIGGFTIPAGSTLLASPYVLHRHAAFWHAADTFCPDRFSTASALPRHAYIPFGIGAHQCIGRHMATIVAQFVLAMTLHRFRVQIVPGQTIVPEPGITLRHRSRLEMTVNEYRE
jgi:cytochrome P450